MIYDIREFGAVGDAVTINTKCIQKAIDTCEKTGGKVVFSEGVYLTGSIRLKSNVELCIESTAVLLGSPKCEDYPEWENLKHVESEKLPRGRNACLIFAEECDNIAITGMGTIDCNGQHFVKACPVYNGGWRYERINDKTPPRVVFFTGCKNVKVTDVTMTNQPAGWSYWIHDCDYVHFDRVKILADVSYPNNDGIHINSSRNVTVSNSCITTGDDAIIVRANNRSLKENKVCEKVTVTNCNLTSYTACIRVGWMRDGVIQNCTFSNLVMTDSNGGICIDLPEVPAFVDRGREETKIENIMFENIVMDGIYGRPLKIDVDPEAWCHSVKNLFFGRIVSKSLEFIYMHGKKENPLKNISFTDCKFDRVDDLENYQNHEGAAWGRHNSVNEMMYAENITFSNTTFSSNVSV